MSKPTKIPEQLHDDHHLSLQLMHEYLEDNLPDKQMHQVERHLLDCELCSDALEGLSFVKDPQQADASVNYLKGKVRKRSLRDPVIKRKKKKAPLLWRHISVAAATIIMVVGSILVFRLNTPKKQVSTISLNNNKERSKAIEETPAGAVQQAPVFSDAAPVEKEDKTKSSISKAYRSNSDVPVSDKKETKALAEPGVALSPEVALDQIEEQIKNEDLATSQENLETVPQVEVAEAKREEKRADALPRKAAPVPSSAVGITQNFITVSGKVAAASDTTLPLQGVKVTIKGTNKTVLTDYRGRFSLAVPPSSTLIFSYEGMNNMEVSVVKRKNFDILLKREGEEEESLTEEVSEEVTEDNLSYKPQPENGTMSYRSYLKKNLQYPQEARKRNITGNVRVEFTVNADGKLTDFVIKKGLGYGCDEEAIRLIKEGPAWKPAISNGKKVNRKITVFVPFK